MVDWEETELIWRSRGGWDLTVVAGEWLCIVPGEEPPGHLCNRTGRYNICTVESLNVDVDTLQAHQCGHLEGNLIEDTLKAPRVHTIFLKDTPMWNLPSGQWTL